MENNNKVFIYLLVIFFAIFIGSGLFLVINKKTVPEIKETTVSTSTIKQEKMVIPTSQPSRGFLNLKLTDSLNNNGFTKGDLINLEVFGDSDGENISGFDLVLEYDPLAFSFVSTQSSISGFKVYSYKKDNRLTLTVVKISTNTASSIFKNTKLVDLVFKSEKSGKYNFETLARSGKETTKLVNNKTEVLNPTVNDIKITIN